jgi:hypothetical protein
MQKFSEKYIVISEFLRRVASVTIVVALILGQPETAAAYVGPGAGLSIVGSLLAFLAAIVIGVFGFIWFPIRRYLRKRKQASERRSEEADSASQESTDDQQGQPVKQGESDA